MTKATEGRIGASEVSRPRARSQELPPSTSDAAVAPRVGGPTPTPLTPREREIGEMAARGVCNDEIAHRVGVARRTVEFHLSNAYVKLGIFRRTQLRDALWSDVCPECGRAREPARRARQKWGD